MNSVFFEIIEVALLLFVGVLAASTLIVRKRPAAAPPAFPSAPTEKTWTETGLRDLQSQGFNLVSLVPTPSHNVAEFSIRGVTGSEQGSIVFWNEARATIAWHSGQYVMYSQLNGSSPTEYAGKVGGASERSVVIKDENERLAAEIDPLREGLEFSYTIACSGAAYAVAVPSDTAPSERALCTVLKFGETVAAYQAFKVGDLSDYVALREDLPESACVAVLVCSLLR